jgi:uncharacterized protein
MASNKSTTTGVNGIIEKLQHYLPSQGPLRDFIHHNTLHAFQDHEFHEGIQKCSFIFGTKVYLNLSEYQKMYTEGQISDFALNKSIAKFSKDSKLTKQDLLDAQNNKTFTKRIGSLRGLWKEHFHIDIDHRVQSLLFRYLSSYLDQGISNWTPPTKEVGFLNSLRDLDNNPFTTLFFCVNGRARQLLQDKETTLEDLLRIVVGDEKLFENYLFDQQFSHPGWSGLVSYIEHQPESLLRPRKISLKEVIHFELLLEIDYLDHVLGNTWTPLSSLHPTAKDLLAPLKSNIHNVHLQIWQEALENTFYDSTLCAVHSAAQTNKLSLNSEETRPLFQALFCIDDREFSLRTYIELAEPNAVTYGTPGFFGVEFYFKPDKSKHLTKLCPAPLFPKHIIRETGSRHQFTKDLHFHPETHSFLGGWISTYTFGFWSAIQLFFNIFRPSLNSATSTSLRHTDTVSDLSIVNDHIHNHDHDLQVGYTLDEMTDRAYNTLMSIGLTHNFAEIVYLIGHGSSSVNNPHYAAYDCGACSGRPGSVNARVFAYIANHEEVRKKLKERGIDIPRDTIFVGAIHDTTRDEVEFYDETRFSIEKHPVHLKGKKVFLTALANNAKERLRRFENSDIHADAKTANENVIQRSVSLFEPRPELNHATNSLCIVGRRYLTKNVFLDRRAFLNSYNPTIDPQGEILTRILNAAVPVCGGINLEYFFSRVDNLKLGAGTKLPHNVVGLIAVANGADGDLRPGLPSQMIEVHDPLRLLILVEHSPEVALLAVQRNPATYEWVKNEWVKYACINPKDSSISIFSNEKMEPYTLHQEPLLIKDLKEYIESSRGNLKVGLFKDGGYE